MVEVGLTMTEALLPRLPDQAYEGAPEAVSVVVAPLHIVVVPPMEAVGRLFTVTVTEAVEIQLFASVTETEYVVLAVGDTMTAALVPSVPFQR